MVCVHMSRNMYDLKLFSSNFLSQNFSSFSGPLVTPNTGANMFYPGYVFYWFIVGAEISALAVMDYTVNSIN